MSREYVYLFYENERVGKDAYAEYHPRLIAVYGSMKRAKEELYKTEKEFDEKGIAHYPLKYNDTVLILAGEELSYEIVKRKVE